MQYVVDTKSGNELSVLGFGCMRFPRDKAKTEQLILKAVDTGVNYFDTAYTYSNIEAALGDIVHRNGLRERIYLATKLPYRKCRIYSDFDKLFGEQLERLKTDQIRPSRERAQKHRPGREHHINQWRLDTRNHKAALLVWGCRCAHARLLQRQEGVCRAGEGLC